MMAMDNNKFFVQYNRSDIDALVSERPGETKLGELISVPGEETLDTFLEKTLASFVVIGIAEDIGIVANYGRPGSSNTWNLFLRSFLNIQANSFTKPGMVAIAGYFSFDTIKDGISSADNPDEMIVKYRDAVATIDEVVAELIQRVVSHGKIPIVVGGGHNNCFPLIKGTALALRSRKGINCINLDAHLDFRISEGRHSGNGFRYAKDGGFLNRYFVIGVHENYLNESIVKEIRHRKDVDFTTYEDIFIHRKKNWRKALKTAVKFVGEKITGLELDLDSISNVPSSAMTPCGTTTREALQYIDHITAHCDVAYLHICEGIATADNSVGKLVAYLASQFVKSFKNEVVVRRKHLARLKK